MTSARPCPPVPWPFYPLVFPPTIRDKDCQLGIYLHLWSVANPFSYRAFIWKEGIIEFCPPPGYVKGTCRKTHQEHVSSMSCCQGCTSGWEPYEMKGHFLIFFFWRLKFQDFCSLGALVSPWLVDSKLFVSLFVFVFQDRLLSVALTVLQLAL